MKHPAKPIAAPDAEAQDAGVTLAPLRAMLVVSAIAGAKSGLSLAELCAQIAAPKTSLHTLLKSLAKGGYVELADGGYQLGPSAYSLASTITRNRNFPGNLRSSLAKVQQRSGETVMIAVPADNWKDAVYVDVIESNHPLRYMPVIGGRVPLYCTAPGLVMLAFAPERELAKYVRTVAFERLTPQTVVDERGLRALVGDAKAAGVAASSALVDGLSGISAPIFDDRGKLLAAVTLAGPTARLDRDRDFLVSLIREAGVQMSRMAGYAGVYPGRDVVRKRAA